MEDDATPGRARSGKAKSETISVRLNARVRYLVELAARKQRRTLSSYVAWAVEDSLSRVFITDEVDSRGNGKSISEVAMSLWDPEGSERLARLAFKYPELLTYHEQLVWKLIRENRHLWERSWSDNSTRDLSEGDLNWQLLHETWETFNAVARGDKPKSELPSLPSAPGFDDEDPSS